MHATQRQWLFPLLISLGIFDFIFQAKAAQSIQGLVDLLQRRIPAHADNFEFQLRGNYTLGITNDDYLVSQSSVGKILVEGNSLSALASGLHRYFTDILHVDIWWYIGSQLHLAPEQFPTLNSTLKGSTIVSWRYHFNTVTFSYTAAFWSWKDWELQLDWMSLHGINLSLAWVGYEKILLSTLLTTGLTTTEILSFFSGPAFQAWNRFGNIQRSWGGTLPLSWIEDQHLLQRKIVKRMVELGITPVLPAFTGFVPEELRRVAPNANIINGSGYWSEIFPAKYSNDSFLYPTDPLFTTLQHTFLTIQSEYYGSVTHIYTLDQYNENNPASGDPSYLASVSRGTYQSLQSFDSKAVWMLQGWLFYALSPFWTQERIEAYIGGVPNNESMLILDLFSESFPQWENTHQYYGKPWIWCQVHGYGGTLGLYGQIYNITNSSIEAFRASEKMVGMGNTMEGQEGNGLMYELLLDQAWDTISIDTEDYFKSWVDKRYHISGEDQKIPGEAYEAWDLLRTTAYNNTNLTLADSAPKSLLEMQPNITEFHGRLGQSLTVDLYSPNDLFRAWKLLYNASLVAPGLWEGEGWKFDMVDVTRQVLAERFKSVYVGLIGKYENGMNVEGDGEELKEILRSLDRVLSTSSHFRLDTWVHSAVSSSPISSLANSSLLVSFDHSSPPNLNLTQTQQFFAYNAINQITIWGPTGQIEDYASKSWAGLVGGYYLPRWEIFFEYIREVKITECNTTEIKRRLMVFEEEWQLEGVLDDGNDFKGEDGERGLKGLVEYLVRQFELNLRSDQATGTATATVAAAAAAAAATTTTITKRGRAYCYSTSLMSILTHHMEAQIEAMTNEEQRSTVSDMTTIQTLLPGAMDYTKISQSVLVESGKVIEPKNFLQETANTPMKVDLPQEIIRDICFYVDKDDLPNIRLVSHAYSHAAAVQMFRTMKLSFTRASFERLINVSQSINLRHNILELIYEIQWIKKGVGLTLSPDHLELHFSHQSQLDEALTKLTNLNTIRIEPIQRPDQELKTQIPFINPSTLMFNPLWSLFVSSLNNLPKLRTIIAPNTVQPKRQIRADLSNAEKEALGRLYRLSFGFDDCFSAHIDTILSYAHNLRSLELKNLGGVKDIAEIVKPSRKFRSLVSLKLDGFNLNEQYFKQFLLGNAKSLRSLSLRNMKLEITEEEYVSESYLKNNQWIRMFYFLGQSMRLEKIELFGKFETSLSGTWAAQEFSEGDEFYQPSSLMLRLKQFITHVGGSSFPLPHPDLDLTNVDLKKYGNNSGLYWFMIRQKVGTIRLLEKKPSQLAVLQDVLYWGPSIPSSDFEDSEEFEEDTESEGDVDLDDWQYDSDDHLNGEDYQEESDMNSALPESHDPLPSSNSESTADHDGSQFDPYEYLSDIEDPLIKLGDSRGEKTAFEQLKDQFLASKPTWTDDEKAALTSLLGDGQITIKGESSDSSATEEEEETLFSTASIE
ncbi:hypothetical protein EYC80_000834 [Monilinia laxa]|uniref:F-box domain-containing protein n=1 Tax=Monilinia laxa TaxID=61186 RepID=A0A5N6K7F7_MONLA|nr:hypothetical protein EYC80_000834 [Monilinia laxa]